MPSTRRCSTSSAEQLEALGADDNVRIVVLRGSGRHFCTGADLASRGGRGTPRSRRARATHRCATCWSRSTRCRSRRSRSCMAARSAAAPASRPAATSRIATEAAFFSIPEVRVGMPPLGVMPFLIRAMGHRSFRRYGLSGERIAAAEALRLGLVHQVCDAASLEETRRAHRRRAAAWRARRDRGAQGGLGAVRLAAARPPSWRMPRRTIRRRRRRPKASRASVRSASRAGIRNRPDPTGLRNVQRGVRWTSKHRRRKSRR